MFGTEGSDCNRLFTFPDGKCAIITNHVESKTTVSSWRLWLVSQMSTLWRYDWNRWSCNIRSRSHGAGEV